MASLLDTKSEVPSRLGSPWSGLRALGCNGNGYRVPTGQVAGAGGSTDYKAFPSLALSFELGLGMAIMTDCFRIDVATENSSMEDIDKAVVMVGTSIRRKTTLFLLIRNLP